MKKKLVFMILPEFGYGGAEKSFCALSIELSKKFIVTIIVFNNEIAPAYPIAGNVISLNVPASNNLFSKIFFFIKRVRLLYKIKKNLGPDISISFLEGADYINVLSKNKDKIILSVRGSKLYDQNIKGISGYLRNKYFIPYLYNKSDKITVLNYGIKLELEEKYKITKPISVIYNSINTKSVKEKSDININSQFSQLFKHLTIISHGRLAVEKGYSQFLDVLSLVLKKSPHIKFILIGDGNEKPLLIKKCSQLNLTYFDIDSANEFSIDKNVYFLGYQPNPYQFIKLANLHVLPSLHEGFGNALLEAMCCRTPVVSTNCPYGPAEILSDNSEKRSNKKIVKAKYGILAPQFSCSNSIKEWSRCIVELFDNQEMLDHYAKAGYERASEFTPQKLISKWESTIME